MRQPAQSLDREAGSQILDDVVNQITEKLQTGAPFDLEAYVREYPELEDQLRKLLPGIQMLADLGHAPADTLSPKSPDTGASSEPARGTLGDYRILREVGRGGMGVVYEAEQVSLGRKVALKVLPFAAMMDKRQLQRFQNEARAAASLRHPNIVQVHFVGCERAVHFYAMDYIEGQTLAEVIGYLRRPEETADETSKKASNAVSDLADSLTSGRFTPAKGSSGAEAPTVAYAQDQTPGAASETKRTPQAAISTERSTKTPAYFRSIAEIGLQVAEALDHAHQNGVVHRDVKPSNVILDNSGKPWVTDFGLARIETDATLTVTGDLLGTVRYMSPEQALAKRIVVDHRTDVYSLGATLYELLTLRPVFSGQDRQELLRQIAFEEPKAPRKLNKAIPEELEIIVLKAMAKNPAERYETAQELADDLRRFLEDRPIRARRPTIVQLAAKWLRRHKPIVWSAAVSTFLLLVVGLVGLGIGNILITKERDEKDAALQEKTNALEERDNAYTSAEAERRRAEGNLGLALAAMDAVYLDAIGRDKLLGEPVAQPERMSEEGYESEERPPLTELERELLKRGLDFYDQFAQENADAPRAAAQTAQAYYRVALLQAGLGETEDAEASYRSAIERFKRLTKEEPNNAGHFRGLGDAYLGLASVVREWGAAKELLENSRCAYSTAIELRPDDAASWRHRADVYRQLGAQDKEIADLNEAIRLDPAYRWAYGHRAQAHVHMKNYDRALADCSELIRLAPTDHWAYRIRAQAYLATKDYDRSLADCSEAIRANPKEFHTYFIRTRAYIAKGDHERVIADAEKMLQIALPNSTLYGQTVRALAEACEKSQQWDRAVAVYSNLIELKPDESQFWWARANCRLRLQRWDEATEDYAQSIKLNPDNQEAWKARAEAYREMHRYEDSINDCDQAIRLDPDVFHAYGCRGRAYLALSQCEKAIADFDTALRLAPEQSFWLFPLRGMAYAKLESLDQAVNDFKKGLEFDRTTGWVWEQLLDVEFARGSSAETTQAIAAEGAAAGAWAELFLQHAAWNLLLNRRDEYERACREIAWRFTDSTKPGEVSLVARAAALTNEPVLETGLLVEIAARAVDAEPTSGALHVLGLSLLRDGQEDTAIERFNQSLDQTWPCKPVNWLGLAIAHSAGGRDSQAREWLKKSQEWFQENPLDLTSELHINDRIACQLLLREAELLLGKSEQEKEDAKSKEED